MTTEKPRRTRRPRYSKLVDELMAERERERAQHAEPTEPRWSVRDIPLIEYDEFGMPVQDTPGDSSDHGPHYGVLWRQRGR